MYIADAHCDTLSGMLQNNEGIVENSLQVSVESIKSAGFEGYLQFFAIFVSPSISYDEGQKATRDMIGLFNDMGKKGLMKTVKESDDLGKPGINGLLSMEGLYFSEETPETADELYEKGVRCLSLTWNPDNAFSGGISGISGEGLSKKGRRLVERAFELGMLLDVSHISDKGFYDVAEIAHKHGKPFAATHSNARGLCHHRRNLDDEMLRTVAAGGGFTGINMYSCFLSDDCNAGIEDVIRHIEYICSRTGPDCVAFGSDFDGIDRNKSAIDGPAFLGDVLERLLTLNYNEDDVRKIASGNIHRVLESVLKKG